MFDAISVLKKNSIERSRLEAERARLIHELANMAETDSLTRLLNRRAFEKRTRGLIAHSANDESDVALIMFDIDHFKRINDTHGHPVGDEALRLVAKLCRRHFGRSDIVARIGGEEFAVVTTVRLPQEGWAAAERMRKDIAATRVPTGDGRYCQMTASFGIAFASSDAEPEVTSLLKQADRMLYQAKAAGRNRVMPEAIRSTSPACARPFDA